MLRMLPEYYDYMEQEPDSFIAKMFGMFSVKIDKFESLHVMIMQNTMPHIDGAEMHYVFDMKGSSINREVLKKKKNSELKRPTGGRVLKDLDYVRLKELKNFFNLDEDMSEPILSQLCKDSSFLMSQQFMDYSLLLGIRKIEDGSAPDESTKMNLANFAINEPSIVSEGNAGVQ